MRFKVKNFLFIFLLLMAFSVSCYAEKNEFIAQWYDFSKVKSIMFYPPDGSEIYNTIDARNAESIAKRVIDDKIASDLSPAIRSYHMDALIKRIVTIENINVFSVPEEEFGKLIYDKLPEYCDLTINVYPADYGLQPEGAHCAIYFSVIDTKTEQEVWSRMDYRFKPKYTIFDNVDPKDICERIMNSFMSDFIDKLQEGR